MKFDELDSKMRVFETTHDHMILPGIHIVARIDGRGFTRLTKEVHQFEAPFDMKFRDYMIKTAEHLMQCGFQVVYAFTQSDEISLLFHLGEEVFSRKARKYNSILAGEASAKFSLLLNGHAAFDCRLCLLPSIDLVIDYFRWRNEDAHRNALNAHCYWMLRKEGQSATQATSYLSGKSVGFKNDLLFERGINFNELPSWQKRGIGLYWEEFEKPSQNPKTGASVLATRRRIKVNMNLPMRDNYSTFVQRLVQENT